MFTFDTNPIIYFLSGDKEAVSLVSEIILSDNAVIYIPTVVRLELLSKPEMSPGEKTAILEFLSQFRSMALDQNIADIAADLRRIYKLKTADSIIAATAIFTGSALVTRNVKDFKNIQGLIVKNV